jgi:hypothetical protein
MICLVTSTKVENGGINGQVSAVKLEVEARKLQPENAKLHLLNLRKQPSVSPALE